MKRQRRVLSALAFLACILALVPGPARASRVTASAAWTATLQQARGQTVNWYLWGGSTLVNNLLDNYIAPNVKRLYGVTIHRVPISDTVDAVNKVVNEKQAGRTTNGSVDLIWINGENFYSMQQANLLYKFADQLPTKQYVNWASSETSLDFGQPVNYYESPWDASQFVMIYDKARTPSPPTSVMGLVAWIKAHPGRFTYSAPPDFTGTAFLTCLLYAVTGGPSHWIHGLDKAYYNANIGKLWTLLNQIKPDLWRQGATYPQSIDNVDQLFANQEVDFDMNYSPAFPQAEIDKGAFPKTAREFVFDSGVVANDAYVAIPFNSPHKAAAMVVANFLDTPDAQLTMSSPKWWGDSPTIDVRRLSPTWQQKFAAQFQGTVILPAATLASHALPPLSPPVLTKLEADWKKNVLEH